ncbi:hypothetical protein C5167_042107 [Papaver somniferum]|uniref:uncharacterized protein LOC113330536 n=1 Tax=Papaver somniferum TaxID=3469 RepID=UPI000E6F820A|nr:uncharacterized protein LOC113330536 [Papaver somniferum]RZC87175.1 hypothetical protein C5167_042107 [Papaver somniferum]
MENYYTQPTYPSDSRDSSPRSSTREIDCENSWPDQEQSNYKVKFMCSYGGKILPRPHDNQLTYIGGETKILSVDRNIKFSGIISKLNSLSDYNDVYFKYQLPGEDLDALISVTNDEDLEHMMVEFDRLIINHRSNSGSNGGSNKPARLRLFLFSLNNNNNNPSSPTSSNVSTDNQKTTNQQWFVDALNSVNNPLINQSLDSSVSSPPAAVKVPSDFLFGFEKAQLQNNSNIPAKLQQQTQQQEIRQELHRDVSDQSLKKSSAGSDSSAKEEIRQMRQTDEMLARAFHGEHYIQKIPDQQPKLVPVMAPAAATATTVTPMASSQLPTLPTNVPTGYWQQQERQVPVSGGYHVGPSGIVDQPPPLQQQQHQAYLLHAPGGYAPNNMYQQTRPVSGQVNQGPQHGYYGTPQQRVMQDVYREPVYGMGPPPPQPTRMTGGGGYGDGVSMVRTPALPVSRVPVGTESGYTTQMGYDNTGRQVYYTTATGGGGVVVPTPFQTDARQTTGVVNQDGIAKVVLKTPQPQ